MALYKKVTCKICLRLKIHEARELCKSCYKGERRFDFNRNFVWGRDNHTCQMCGKTKNEITFLNTHHLDGNKKNNISNNLLTLCVVCHTKIHLFECKKCGKKENYKQRNQKFCKKCGVIVIKERNKRNMTIYLQRYGKPCLGCGKNLNPKIKRCQPCYFFNRYSGQSISINL